MKSVNTDSPIKLFDVLNNCNVEFVITGGHAVNYHGLIRATEDFDIIIKPDRKNRECLHKALSSMNACWITKEIDPETNIEKTSPVTEAFIRNNHLMMLCTDYGFLDVFDYIPGYPEENIESVFASSHDYKGLKFVSLDWLLKMKKASNRPCDLEDIKQLEEK